MDSTILTNDNTTQTLITIKLDNKNINHNLLNKFLIELEFLQQKYSMTTLNEGNAYVR